MLTLDLNNDTEQELKMLADGQGKAVNQLLKDLVLEYIEDAHDAALGDAAMDELARGEDTVISFEEWEHQLDGVGN
jgi:predicted DNA-binding protein